MSYIFAGREEMNVSLVIEKLYKLFGIKKLMLEGGSEEKALFFDSNMEQYKLAQVE